MQNFQNHARTFPLFHYVVMPLLLLHFLWTLVRLIQDPGPDRAEGLVLAITLLLAALASRTQPLKAQDRVIRLEERLRYAKLLPPDVADKASALPTSQIIALRFADDAELPSLINRTLAGEFATPKDIKLAVKNWRGDYLRV